VADPESQVLLVHQPEFARLPRFGLRNGVDVDNLPLLNQLPSEICDAGPFSSVHEATKGALNHGLVREHRDAIRIVGGLDARVHPPSPPCLHSPLWDHDGGAPRLHLWPTAGWGLPRVGHGPPARQGARGTQLEALTPLG
jgi:hypothetical protein